MSVGVVCQPFSMSTDRCHLYPASTFDSVSSITPGCDDNVNKVYAEGWNSPFNGASNSEPNTSPFLTQYPANQYIRTPSLPVTGPPVTFRHSFEPSPASSSYFPPSSTAGHPSNGPQSTASYPPDVSNTRSSSVAADNPDLDYSWNLNNELSRGKSPKDIGGVYPLGSPKTRATNPPYNPFDPFYEIPIPSGPQPVKPIPSQPLPSSTKPPSISKKRPRSDGAPDSPADSLMPSPKRSKANNSITGLIESSPGLSSAALGLEDSLLLKWRDEELLSWKMVAAKFQHELGRTYNVPALQMRLKRLRERLRAWVEVDVTALRLAHEYWEKKRWEIIADKMLEFGALERWTPQNCQRKWTELSCEVSERASSVATINEVISNPEISNDRSESHA